MARIPKKGYFYTFLHSEKWFSFRFECLTLKNVKYSMGDGVCATLIQRRSFEELTAKKKNKIKRKIQNHETKCILTTGWHEKMLYLQLRKKDIESERHIIYFPTNAHSNRHKTHKNQQKPKCATRQMQKGRKK